MLSERVVRLRTTKESKHPYCRRRRVVVGTLRREKPIRKSEWALLAQGDRTWVTRSQKQSYSTVTDLAKFLG